MFRTLPVADPPPHAVDPPKELVPLFVLELDLPAPGEGWAGQREVEIVPDDIGRAAVARSAARLLFAEGRESEAHAREHAAAVERAAVEQDRLRHAQMGRGVPAGMGSYRYVSC